ncbi:MAG TPA: hypothetical protein VHX16_15770 [Chloroflexota bacterium]|jgi:hypothetical protein|nr:hypothetical protein [Chloroflexota bacterium]
MLLRSTIVLLALADGVLHLWLNQAMFRGNFFGPLPFPSPFPLPMNRLFTLNFVGYVVMAVLFWFANRLLGARQWLIDLLLIVYTALSIAGWVQIGLPNPQGLGYLSKVFEVLLIIAVALHWWSLTQAGGASRNAG